MIASPGEPNGPAVWFSGENNNELVAQIEGADRLAPGDRVEIEGASSRLGFAPGVMARRFRRSTR